MWKCLIERRGNNTMGNDARQMTEIKEWLQGSFFSCEKKRNDLFCAISLDGRMELEQKEDESLGCIPIEEVDELLKKCAYELGIAYE